jgi:hypothetical protein
MDRRPCAPVCMKLLADYVLLPTQGSNSEMVKVQLACLRQR